MVKEDIADGLKNAIEHGASLEQAKMSFMAAGYNKNEVEEASKQIGSGVLPIHKEIKKQKPIQELPKGNPEQHTEQKKTSTKMKIIIFSIVLFILIILLLLVILLRDKIVELF